MQPYATFMRRIRQKADDAAAPPVLIVAIGDSVTQGCMQTGEMNPGAVYHNQVKQSLEKRHPQTPFSVINAGCGGESARGGRLRLVRDVIRHQPDLVIVGYGLNDACSGGLSGVAAFERTLQEMVAHIRSDTEADVVLLTPNRMLTHDNANVAPEWRTKIDLFIRTQTRGVLDAYVDAIRHTAQARGVGLVDVYAAWTQLEADGIDTTLMLANGINHPNADMHALTARLIMNALEKTT